MGPPKEGTLADLLAPEGRRGTLARLLRIYWYQHFSSFAPETRNFSNKDPRVGSRLSRSSAPAGSSAAHKESFLFSPYAT